MTESELRMEARLMALEYFVCHLQTTLYRIVQTTPETRRELADRLRAQMKAVTIPGLSAAQSDLVASEYEAAVERLLKSIAEMAGDA